MHMGGRVVEQTSPTSIGTPVPFSRYVAKSWYAGGGNGGVVGGVFGTKVLGGVVGALGNHNGMLPPRSDGGGIWVGNPSEDAAGGHKEGAGSRCGLTTHEAPATSP